MRKKIQRIYVAGPITPKSINTSNLAIDYLTNVRKMIRVGIDVLLAGFAPFIPALDFTLFLSLQENENISESMIRQFSLNWLTVCDAMLLVPGWKHSEGTEKEMEYAKHLNIPIFESLEDIIKTQKEEK